MPRTFPSLLVLGALLLALSGRAAALDLPEVQRQGVLRHLGIPYAHFVIGADAGLDIELMTAFAKDLGVRYEFVASDWPTVFGDLTGRRTKAKGNEVELLEEMPRRGDAIANGLTVLPWREKVVTFSKPTFPNQVWLVARADSPLVPITPSQDLAADIAAVKQLISGRSLLGKAGTCLDPALYDLAKITEKILLFPGSLNDLAPALLQGEAELTLLDVPDALVALQKWPGKIKILGPVSARQDMAVAFPKDAPALAARFDEFLARIRKDGTYLAMVHKHYPFVRTYYPDFFAER